jgi:hypothetical protein
MNYTMRKTPLERRGRANVQVMATTRDELRRMAQERGVSIGAMVEDLITNFNTNTNTKDTTTP